MLRFYFLSDRFGCRDLSFSCRNQLDLAASFSLPWQVVLEFRYQQWPGFSRVWVLQRSNTCSNKYFRQLPGFSCYPFYRLLAFSLLQPWLPLHLPSQQPSFDIKVFSLHRDDHHRQFMVCHLYYCLGNHLFDLRGLHDHLLMLPRELLVGPF